VKADKAFDLSARVYDLLYRERDAGAEAAYVGSLLQRYQSGTRGVLDLGCGTGRHARALLDLGLEVVGVELSAPMASRARETGDFQVVEGDVRDVRLGRTFDAVLALFHVVSYQTTVDDLIDTFATAAAHLEPGGLFIFDVWSTPAVLAQRPESRVREVSDGSIDVVRTARPVEDVRRSLVEVHYEIQVTERASATSEAFREVHVMRHLTEGEVQLLARISGFEVLQSEEFLTGDKPSTATWGVCHVLRRSVR
jgi:SAM-dependent methyltransferase